VTILGLDIGGANLKAAHTKGVARTVAFPLWKNPLGLRDELTRLTAAMPPFDRLAVTMTGELCDCFESKRDGVLSILQSTRQAFRETSIRVWTNEARFVDAHRLLDAPDAAAAANWLALACWIARRFPSENVLLIDTGSTTTDMVYLQRGTPAPRGLVDAARLESGELVYTGVRRTPICAVLGMEVAAEFFATMLDAYVVAGLVPENAHDRDNADGRPATRAFAHARLARLRCSDADAFPVSAATALAERALRAQWEAVHHAMQRVAAGKPRLDRIVVAGSGEILGRNVCARFDDWSALPITSAAELLGSALSEAACAYAVAMLAAEENADEP